MHRQADRMRAIVNDLLELSRLEASGTEAEEEAVDVPGMLAMIRREVLGLEQRPAEIELQLESEARLLGNESELHSAFTNLVSNAVKYTPASGRVSIRWWTDEDGAHLAVADSGIGISPEHLPRLTERFYRADPGRARRTGGSGLGLAIVKHALQRHGATLDVASEVGRGSTFTCHFPERRIVASETHRSSAQAG
jgi:two-component system, OmpR family, phosphate regulon sensor histidine kinase PhoR